MINLAVEATVSRVDVLVASSKHHVSDISIQGNYVSLFPGKDFGKLVVSGLRASVSMRARDLMANLSLESIGIVDRSPVSTYSKVSDECGLLWGRQFALF